MFDKSRDLRLICLIRHTQTAEGVFGKAFQTESYISCLVFLFASVTFIIQREKQGYFITGDKLVDFMRNTHGCK